MLLKLIVLTFTLVAKALVPIYSTLLGIEIVVIAGTCESICKLVSIFAKA